MTTVATEPTANPTVSGTIATIRAALRRRSGKAWSVTSKRGTSWGWLKIDAPPRRLVDGEMTDADRDELRALLGVQVHKQGVLVPASYDHWREYVDRAEGRTPAKIAEPYWD